MKLNLRSVDLNLLTIFDELVRERNISKTAEKLAMSQPAVSAALQRLRLTFKDELFIRTKSGMLPTPRALQIHTRIQQSLSLITEAISMEESFKPATESRVFTILADNTFEMVALGPLLERLAKLGPHLGIRVETPDNRDFVDSLKRLEVDAMIDYTTPDSDRVESEIIGSQSVVVICRKRHPRIRDSLSTSAYLDEEHVLLNPRDRNFTQLEQVLGGVEVKRNIRLYVHTLTAMASIVAHTDALGTMPVSVATTFARAYDIKYFPLPLETAESPVWLSWPSALNSDSGHRWFIQFLKDSSRIV